MSRARTDDALDRGRDAFARKGWSDAFSYLSRATQAQDADPGALELLAVSAHLLGKDGESEEAWTRAHQGLLQGGEIERAVRCAFHLAMQLLDKGEMARGGGWLARAGKLLEDNPRDCVENGYVLLPQAIMAFEGGNVDAAKEMFEAVSAIAERYDDPDLSSMAHVGIGRALIQQGHAVEGVAFLDDVMIAVTAEEVSPIIAGVIYCVTILACWDLFDIGRAREWTSALSRWCDSQPDLAPFRGQCLVHRSELMQLRGDWGDAMEEARRAAERLADPPGQPAIGMAFYQQAELHRLRGEFDRAEDAYRQASNWGRTPHPGLAQMRLAQARVEDADGAIRRVIDEAEGRVARSRLLPAYVEIMIAVGDVASARAGANELSEIVEDVEAPYLRAVADHAGGAVLLAEGDARAALTLLRRAWTAWQELDAPYESARVRVLIGLACRALGDGDTAAMELDAARWIFERLGAGPDLSRVDSLAGKPTGGRGSPLTDRELEVLRLVASGKTNRAIAGELFLSEKTVARHVANIFTKLDVTTRSAATAYAFTHDLV
ncbi:MAG: LuxR C-terminal-related transcriptional regulator [Actinomycetota bacterium]